MPLSRLTQTLPLDCDDAISGLEAAELPAVLVFLGAGALADGAGTAPLELELDAGADGVGTVAGSAADSVALDLLFLGASVWVGTSAGAALALWSAGASALFFFRPFFLLPESVAEVSGVVAAEALALSSAEVASIFLF